MFFGIEVLKFQQIYQNQQLEEQKLHQHILQHTQNIRIMQKNFIGGKLKTFNVFQKLGQGAFGVVYEAIEDQTGRIVAIKVMTVQSLQKSKKLKQLVQTQVSVLRSCRNQNVIQYIDSFKDNQHIFIVTQFCNGGDLEGYLLKNSLTQDQAVQFLKQILNGFKGLHQVGAMHRDFKTANVLLHDGVCKIADLGFSKQMSQRSIAKTILGTSLTMAPQVLEQKPYGFQADIWSIGVVFYQLLYKKYPYMGKTDHQILYKIKNQKVDLTGVNISNQAKDFLLKCLTPDAKARISWKQIYNHPLINPADQKNQIKVSTIRKSILKNIKKSVISESHIAKNKKFYQTTELPQITTPQQQILIVNKKTQANTQIAPTLTPQLKTGETSMALNLKDLRQRAQLAKQRQDILDRFDSLYMLKRNDLLFFSKFVQPKIANIIPSYNFLDSKSKLCNLTQHSVPGYILSKKSLLQLKKLLESMQKNRPIFFNQHSFDKYIQSQNFKQMKELIRTDIVNLQVLCGLYKGQIKKVGGVGVLPEIIEELTNVMETKNYNFDTLVYGVVGEYKKFLIDSFGDIPVANLDCITNIAEYKQYSQKFSSRSSIDFQSQQVSQRILSRGTEIPSEYQYTLITINLIQLIQALTYYHTNSKPNSKQFQKLLQQIKFKQLQNKYYLSAEMYRKSLAAIDRNKFTESNKKTNGSVGSNSTDVYVNMKNGFKSGSPSTNPHANKPQTPNNMYNQGHHNHFTSPR